MSANETLFHLNPAMFTDKSSCSSSAQTPTGGADRVGLPLRQRRVRPATHQRRRRTGDAALSGPTGLVGDVQRAQPDDEVDVRPALPQPPLPGDLRRLPAALRHHRRGRASAGGHAPAARRVAQRALRNRRVVVGEDEGGAYIGLGGQYQHTVAFSHNYLAAPLVKLYAGSDALHRDHERSPT